MFRMEYRTGDIIEMSPTRIDLPSLGLAHPPDFDCPIVSGGDDQRKGRVERGEVDASVVSLEDVLDGGEGIECLKAVGTIIGGTLAQTGDIPDAHGLVH